MRWRWLAFPDLDVPTLYAVLRLREQVFVVEQACAYLDADGRDPDAHHLLGDDDHGLVAYLRAFPPDPRGEAWIGRVVVAARARGRGLGHALMREGLDRVGDAWGPCPVRLSAQAHLEQFYGALGFETTGPAYDEDGIPHVPMTKSASS